MKLLSLASKLITCHTLFNRRAAYISFSHDSATASYSMPAVQTLIIFLVFEMFVIGSPRISNKSARRPGVITPRSCRPKQYAGRDVAARKILTVGIPASFKGSSSPCSAASNAIGIPTDPEEAVVVFEASFESVPARIGTFAAYRVLKL
jgi:hypothetical protein